MKNFLTRHNLAAETEPPRGKTAAPALGDRVSEKVTGISGVVIAHAKHLTGCDTYLVQPPSIPEDRRPDSFWFDEPRLTVVQRGAVSLDLSEADPVGGFTHDIPRATRNR